MIHEAVHYTITCDTCHRRLADLDGITATFLSYDEARQALDTAGPDLGWSVGAEGQAACPICAARATCALRGHDYGESDDGWPWRLCGCDRDIPSHADQPGSPFEPGACGMEWLVCRRCDHIDEHHVTDPPHDDASDDLDDAGVQPGGHLRQDVPAGPALPTNTSTHPTTSKHKPSRENAMVEPSDRWSA